MFIICRLRSVTKNGTITTTRGNSFVNSTDHSSVLRPGNPVAGEAVAAEHADDQGNDRRRAGDEQGVEEGCGSAIGLWKTAMKFSKVIVFGIQVGGKA